MAWVSTSRSKIARKYDVALLLALFKFKSKNHDRSIVIAWVSISWSRYRDRLKIAWLSYDRWWLLEYRIENWLSIDPGREGDWLSIEPYDRSFDRKLVEYRTRSRRKLIEYWTVRSNVISWVLNSIERDCLSVDLVIAIAWVLKWQLRLPSRANCHRFPQY